MKILTDPDDATLVIGYRAYTVLNFLNLELLGFLDFFHRPVF
jgi:hypothetical protein